MKIVLIIILLIQCALNPIVSAEEPKKSAPAPSSKEVQPVSPDVNPVTQEAVKAGILSCATRVNQVMNFITPGGRSSAHLFLPSSQHDRSLFSVSLEWNMKGAPTVYSSATFAPNQANGCGGMYETIIYWNEKCAALASRQFGSLKSMGVMVENLTVLDGGVLKIFLMPAGEGCISIKKEVVQ